MSRAWLRTIPLLGVVLTFILYFVAALLYPGGTKVDPHTLGYSHFHNYWCDLQDEVAYNGEPNPGRFIALTATILFPISLIPYWWGLPTLFQRSKVRLRRLVQVTGFLSMVLASLMPLAHDLIINVAGPLVFLAFVGSLIGLLQSREFRLVMMAAFSMLFCVVNFLMWRTGYRLDLMPTVQKAAFLSSFAYIFAGTLRMDRLASAV